MKQDNVVAFPKQPIELDRVCPEHRDERCTILILPVVAIERRESSRRRRYCPDHASDGSDVPA